VRCGVEGAKFEMECDVSSVDFKLWTVECGV